MKFRKKQLVLASLVLALGAAVYLTWQFSGPSLSVAEKEEESSQLGAAQLVNNAYIETMSDDLKENSEPANETAGAGISEARMNRQTARDEAVELLEDVLANLDADSDAKENAVTEATAIAQNILKETNVESLLTAKGYTESVAYINNGECSVVVTGGLNESDTLIIQEIVMDQTGLSADKIKIMGTK